MKRNRKKVLGISLLLIVLLGAGMWIADGQLKKRNHPGLKRFVGQLWRNYPASFAVEPPTLDIRIDEGDMALMEGTVEEARERGVILPEGRVSVPAELSIGQDSFKAKIRIKGKMTDHVKGDKWSFRVESKKDGGMFGMQRFSLQHPGTRNYLCDWFYHRLMAGEDIIALRYGFLRVSLNGNDLGVYAYEEHFGPELLEHNGRTEGPLFRFDPALFWEHRLNEMRGVRYNEPFAAYQASAVDAYGSKATAKDPVARQQFEEAVSLMEAFRSGRLPASAVFDVERIAKQHALLDLIGGHHSMDWSDVKFYYDPQRQRIEPVSYESFSANRIRSLAGSGRFTGGGDGRQDLHDAYFNDELIFREYVRQLERMARISYLDSAFQALAPALDTASAILYREFPYKELDRSIYYHNQGIIRRLLDVPKGFHAYRQPNDQGSVVLAVVPIEALPIEVHGLRLRNGTLVPPQQPTIIPVRKSGRVGIPQNVRFAVPDSAALQEPLTVEYSVLGASVRKAVEVFPHSLLDDTSLAPYREQVAPDMRAHPFVLVDEEQRSVVLRPGRWVVDKDLFIPAGYRVEATAPLELDLRNGARIVSRSPLTLRGLEEEPIRIISTDESGGSIMLETGGRSTWKHVHIGPLGYGPGSAITSIGGDVHWSHVAIVGSERRDVLLVQRGTATMKGLVITGGRDQVQLAYVDGKLEDVLLRGAGDDAIVVRGGALVLNDLLTHGTDGTGLKLLAGSELTGRGLTIGSKKEGVSVAEGSTAVVEGGKIKSKGVGLLVKNSSMRYGPSTVTFNKVEVLGEEGSVRVGQGNAVLLDGVEPAIKAEKRKP